MMCFGLKDRKRVKTNHCVIVLLDDTQLVHELHASSTGQDLLDVVIKHLNLLETSYFGLRYFNSFVDASHGYNEPNNNRMEQIWLDVNKSAIKQLKDVHSMTVYFGVKYYASDPCKLAEEITRYQFFLQCKQDILHSRLPISFELAIELFALAVQSELGDYDSQRHQDGYVSEFQFLPNQSVALEKRVALFHRNLTGQVPATAELNFLERVKWLDLYGCELHPIQYEDNKGEEYSLGLNPSGVLVLRNKLKVAHYLWPRIIKTKCQGRCFLMDVIDNKANRNERHRFGFRLPDKKASRKLHWAIDEHKSFHHLIHDSATLNQLAHRQQQHQQQQAIKLGQRFRNSIRSAINVGQLGGVIGNTMQHQLAQQHQQQKLRSSIKSLSNQQAAMIQQQYNVALDSRPPPTVVRMPSRRYSNRSLTRGPYGIETSASAGNGNGLPNVASIGLAHTMVDSQRQQAIMMMNQFNQMNTIIGKSQTLKPMPASNKLDSREAKRNPYYHQMMMMMANSQVPADVAILPPGRHVVQPSIYKASSVVNGINQLGVKQDGSQHGGAMMQFFNTRPQYPVAYNSSGHESPKSTKSAIAPSSVLKLASKKLAKQQQLLYVNQPDIQPLLAYDPNRQQQMYSPVNGQYYNGYNMGTTSANHSPRSVRSARLASRHKSKSTSENLHLLHSANYMQPVVDGNINQNNKMLLATTQLVQQQQQQHQSMPPPGYNNSSNPAQKQRFLCSDNESEVSRMSKRPVISGNSKKRTTFVLNTDQANLLLNTNGLLDGRCKQQAMMARGLGAHLSDGEDDYCCSRSDCSSIDDGGDKNDYGNMAHQQQSRESGGQKMVSQQQRRRRSSVTSHDSAQQAHLRGSSINVGQVPINNQQEWNAIRKRHNEFSSGKGFLMNPALDQCSPGAEGDNIARRRQSVYKQEDLNNSNNKTSNNASTNSSQLIKNISNKQATPILLSMNYEQANANNKAVQLLNLQRQQLNSQSSDGGPTKSPLSVVDSAPSSVASSPQVTGSQQQSALKSNKTTDSTASSSTTSGYYAGSNSTGSASVDSDSQTVDGHQSIGAKQQAQSAKVADSGRHQVKQNNYPSFNDWQEQSSRVKIALGSYASKMSGNRHLTSNQPYFKGTLTDSRQRSKSEKQQQSYQGETNNNEDSQINQNLQPAPINIGQQWSPLNQIQQHAPSSLKYVSFDV